MFRQKEIFMTDYQEVKKGIKQAELDKTVYYTKTFFCIVFGVIVGLVTHSWLLGVLAWIIPGVFSARKYFEMKK